MVRLTLSFPGDDFARALESWLWLPIDGMVPRFTSPFGDVVLQDGTGFWFLDLIEGSLTQAWADTADLESSLRSPEGQDRYLLAGLAVAADEDGMTLGAGDVYSFTVPPVLGGKLEVDNVEVADFVVAVNIAGQVHQQVKDLPEGTEITGFSIGDQ